MDYVSLMPSVDEDIRFANWFKSTFRHLDKFKYSSGEGHCYFETIGPVRGGYFPDRLVIRIATFSQSTGEHSKQKKVFIWKILVALKYFDQNPQETMSTNFFQADKFCEITGISGPWEDVESEYLAICRACRPYLARLAS